ncbi:MAG: suppressor of fused domain protein [Bacteroides sp.]|nr:suppressor of fused domain protein [Bacteroides sp.]
MTDAPDFGPELYTAEEEELVKKHIERHCGKIEKIFHEIYSPDIRVDICVIPPAKKRDYYTLVTMGMGAHRMNVPEELGEYGLERAEIMIALPSDWKVYGEEERWYWPIRLLKDTARLPVNENTWLAWGHTVDNMESYDDTTALCGTLLIDPEIGGEGCGALALPNGEKVNFYQLIPLYREEMEYKVANDTDSLLDLMADTVSYVVDINRLNSAESFAAGELGLCSITLDDAAYHKDAIYEKNLPIDDIAAYNHLAIYLRWSIERGLMGDMFKEKYSDIMEQVTENTNAPERIPDLRLLLRDSKELKGKLIYPCFNDEGIAFSEWYYGDGIDEAHNYPCDVDRYAEKYFGAQRYNSEEFQDEAYLFVPWNEEYYRGMAKVIEKNYRKWKKMKGGKNGP